MKKLTSALLVLSLVLGGVALAIAADIPQVPNNGSLSGLQKITDQEAQEIRGMGLGSGFMYAGANGIANPTCVPQNNNYNYSTLNTCVPKLWLSPGPHKK